MQTGFVVGLFDDQELIGIATAGWPVARHLSDGYTLEINRTCVNGTHKNANSMLYGAIGRAAKALGYRRLVTYTLQTESGASLKAAGFTLAAEAATGSWHRPNTGRIRYDYNLFGERRQALGQAKYRWERQL